MFAENFITLLQIKKITAYKVAKDTGISQGLCNEYKNGIKTPTIENLIKIADYLDCSVDYLLGRTDTPNMSNRVDNSVLINGSINNNSHSTLNVATPPQDEMMQQLINGFKTLSFENKLKIMNALFELKKEN